MKIGASGDYPRGRLNPQDKGALTLALYFHGDALVIDFGKEVTWIGMGREELRGLIAVLQDKLKQMETKP